MTEELRILQKITDVELKAKSSESGFSYATILGPFPSVCALQSWSWDKAVMNETKKKKKMGRCREKLPVHTKIK